MKLQSGYQRITKHILLNILCFKDNQTMKFVQLIEHRNRNVFLYKLCRKGTGKLVSDSFFFLKKALYQVKASGLQLDLIIFRQLSNWHTIETNCLKLYTVDPEIYSIFDFLDKGLRTVSPVHFVYDFLTKVFFMLYSIN